ncbi:MAG: hypothetical protein D6725_03670 [Planctomycetota bacterium]|nr:MAG: hypothetical protein D6725_03670 [Planctomycetota bacterium]
MNDFVQIVAIGVPVGIVLGTLYFAALWQATQRLTMRRTLREWWMGAVLRLAGLALLLLLLAVCAPVALIGVLPGLMLARVFAVRRVGRAPARSDNAGRR